MSGIIRQALTIQLLKAQIMKFYHVSEPSQIVHTACYICIQDTVCNIRTICIVTRDLINTRKNGLSEKAGHKITEILGADEIHPLRNFIALVSEQPHRSSKTESMINYEIMIVSKSKPGTYKLKRLERDTLVSHYNSGFLANVIRTGNSFLDIRWLKKRYY